MDRACLTSLLLHRLHTLSFSSGVRSRPDVLSQDGCLQWVVWQGWPLEGCRGKLVYRANYHLCPRWRRLQTAAPCKQVLETSLPQAFLLTTRGPCPPSQSPMFAGPEPTKLSRPDPAWSMAVLSDLFRPWAGRPSLGWQLLLSHLH